MSDDWMKTPGISLRSIKEIASWPQEKRLRTAVMLGYNDTEAGQRMKKNHAIHMDRLRERYEEMKKGGTETEVVEEREEVKTTLPSSPQFGTSSNFCDKSGNRMKKNIQSASQGHIPASIPVRKPQQQQGFVDFPSIPNAEKFEGFSKKSQQQQQWNNRSVCPPSRNAETIKKPPQLQPLSIIIEEETQKEDGKEPKRNMHWNREPDKFAFFGVMRQTPLQLSDRTHSSLDSPNCSTPNEDQIFSHETSPVQESITNKEEEVVKDGFTRNKPYFEAVLPLPKCVNTTVKEKVRRHDKEPEAAGKRYLKPLDALQKSDLHRVQTEIKFDKRRVRKWVGRFGQFPPLPDELMDTVRPRRYSNPMAYAFDCADLLVSDEVTEVDKEMQEAERIFKKMIPWMKKNLNREWELEDSERIDLPSTGSFVRVRVVGVKGSSGTVVPWEQFDMVNETLASYVHISRPPRVHPFAMHEEFVVLEQESDDMGMSEYRRGWMFKGDQKEVSVLLIDERRIVTVSRSALFKTNMDDGLFENMPPPLCVKANFHRQVMAHEMRLLMLGCTADCRVDEKVEEEEEGEGEKEEEALELYLHKIDTSSEKRRVTIDTLFCSEACAGACAYHQNELKEK